MVETEGYSPHGGSAQGYPVSLVGAVYKASTLAGHPVSAAREALDLLAELGGATPVVAADLEDRAALRAAGRSVGNWERSLPAAETDALVLLTAARKSAAARVQDLDLEVA